jgi:signal-transduction protein with cAMP-binding, CBS, and nucleotidyltransferase domain
MRLIEDIMTRQPLITIGPHAGVADALHLIAERDVRHLLVVGDRGLIGSVCICDLETADLRESVVACARTDVRTLDAGATAFEAARCMLDEDLDCLPITRHGALAGIVTLGDLRRAGVLECHPERCVACGSRDHVRCSGRARGVGLCLQCMHKAEPPSWDDDLGGGD